jgi:hypothetical protein
MSPLVFVKRVKRHYSLQAPKARQEMAFRMTRVGKSRLGYSVMFFLELAHWAQHVDPFA